MKISNFEKQLKKRILDILPGTTPGVVVQAYQGGRKVCDLEVGDTYTYYDLASVTKVIFGTQAMMKAFSEGKWDLNTKISEILDWFPEKNTLIKEILNHSAGFPWWAPFYKEIDIKAPIEDRWVQLSQLIKNLKFEYKDESIYSDVGFMTLVFILEKMYDKPLLDIWTDLKEKFYPESSFEFHLNNRPKSDRHLYAPTEKCPWRGYVLQGEVHDENCWALGGVSTHAGLFGSIDDMGWFGLFVRSQLKGISRTLIRQKTAELFATRSRPIGNGDWALGFMMPTPGGSSAGNYFSVRSIGHTGFTGTSFWFDPDQDLLVLILSNRVAFGRQNEEFKKIRPQIHNWIVEGIRKAGDL